MEVVLEHHSAPAAADHPGQRDSHHDFDAQHLRHGAGPHGRRARSVHGDLVLVRLQLHFPQPGPRERMCARGLPAPDQPAADPRLPSPAEPGGTPMSAPTGVARTRRSVARVRMRRRTKDKYVRPRGGRGADVLTYLAFLVTLIFFGGPLLWILSLSIKTVAEVNDPSLKLIPDEPTLDNYRQVLSTAQF